MTDTTFRESSTQPAIAGMHLDSRSHCDVNGDRTSHVVVTDTHGHVLGSVGQVKRAEQMYYARPAEGAKWSGPFTTSVDAMAVTVMTFNATAFGAHTEKIVREYERGLITRCERDFELGLIMIQYERQARNDVIIVGRE